MKNDESSPPSAHKSLTLTPDEKMAELEKRLNESLKNMQQTLLLAVSKSAGVPMEEPEPLPPPPPLTKNDLKIQLADFFLEAWCNQSRQLNSRQAAVVERFNKADAQLLMKKILSWKE